MGLLTTLLTNAIGPAVAGAFGIGGSILNNKSTSDTNKANMAIAQMNNEWSEKMMEKQNQMNIDQWNREALFTQQQTKNANAFTEYMQNKANEFNSASAQAQRFKEAGLNPALMMGGGSAGTASGASGAVGSTPSGNSVGLPSPTTPNIQPLRYDGFAAAISNTIQQSMALSRNNAEIDSLEKRTDSELALARAKIAEMYENTRSIKFKNELNDITKDLQVSHMNEDFLRKVQERSNMEEQQKLIQQQIIAQDIINQNLPEKLAMEVAVMASQRDLNKFNTDHDLAKVISSLEKRGYKLSERERKIIFASLKQFVGYAPTRGISSMPSAFATIGNVIGNAIK